METIPYCSVTGPCGHTTDFDLSCIAPDAFACCSCGREWHVIQGPPIVHPSGWVEPGKRTVCDGPAAGSRASKARRIRRPGRVQLCPVASRAEAESLLFLGAQLFAVSEQDETAQPVQSAAELENFTPDRLLFLTPIGR